MSEKEEVAFTDFKSSISTGEFESLFRLAESQYERISRLINTRNDFNKKSLEKIEEVRALTSKTKDNEPLLQIERVVSLMIKSSNEKILEVVGNDIEDIDNITEFLNRFSCSNKDKTDKYSKIDTSFLYD